MTLSAWRTRNSAGVTTECGARTSRGIGEGGGDSVEKGKELRTGRYKHQINGGIGE